MFKTKEEAKKAFDKSLISVRYWLLGRKYYQASKAMEYAMLLHDGFRKDHITPEFIHQLGMVQFARAYEAYLLYPEDTYSTLFLHDTIEDKNITKEEIERQFGSRVATSTWLLSKITRGIKKDLSQYYKEMELDPIATVGKGIDRINNFQSMVGVFTRNGQKLYIEETETYILPMLKKARRTFVEQEVIYENLKYTLQSQADLIMEIHSAEEKTEKNET